MNPDLETVFNAIRLVASRPDGNQNCPAYIDQIWNMLPETMQQGVTMMGLRHHIRSLIANGLVAKAEHGGFILA